MFFWSYFYKKYEDWDMKMKRKVSRLDIGHWSSSVRCGISKRSQSVNWLLKFVEKFDSCQIFENCINHICLVGVNKDFGTRKRKVVVDWRREKTVVKKFQPWEEVRKFDIKVRKNCIWKEKSYMGSKVNLKDWI